MVQAEKKQSASPTKLKQHFRPKLEECGFDSTKNRLLTIVQNNWLAGEQGMDSPHLRQDNRRDLASFDWLQNQGFIASTGTHYYPKFLGFCVLLVSGNAKAIKLRTVMDSILKLVDSFMSQRPLVPRKPISDVAAALRSDEHRALLLPALQLMQEGGMGVYFNPDPAGDAHLGYSDEIYRRKNATAVAWNFLSGRSMSPHFATEINPVSIPFDLNRLKISPDTYSNAGKALERLLSHPESAVTAAKSALEATFKHVLGDVDVAASLPKLASQCRDRLRLDGEFVEIGRGIVATSQAVNGIRNAYGDSHGKGLQDRGPTRAEAQLAVGTALLLCDFLLDRWEVVRSNNG